MFKAGGARGAEQYMRSSGAHRAERPSNVLFVPYSLDCLLC